MYTKWVLLRKKFNIDSFDDLNRYNKVIYGNKLEFKTIFLVINILLSKEMFISKRFRVSFILKSIQVLESIIMKMIFEPYIGFKDEKWNYSNIKWEW